MPRYRGITTSTWCPSLANARGKRSEHVRKSPGLGKRVHFGRDHEDPHS